jgi:hypothetical protein
MMEEGPGFGSGPFLFETASREPGTAGNGNCAKVMGGMEPVEMDGRQVN